MTDDAPDTRDTVVETHRERTRRLVDELMRVEGAGQNPRHLVDMAHAAVLEETGWELRQVLTHLQARLELSLHRGDDGPELSTEEVQGLLTSIQRASALLDISLDRNETAKQMIPVETEAFDLAEALGDWMEREGLLGRDHIEFPMEPAPVRGDATKLPKAIGTIIERFAAECDPPDCVVKGWLRWEGDRVKGFVGLTGGKVQLEALMDEIASPLPVGDVRFDMALVRAVIERHGGELGVHQEGQAIGYAFELGALDKELR